MSQDILGMFINGFVMNKYACKSINKTTNKVQG